MKVLLYSPDVDTIGALLPFLRCAGHVIEAATDVVDAAGLIDVYVDDFDAGLFDCGVSGKLPQVVADLSKRPPILAFADAGAGKLVSLLDSGADDGMLLPLDPAELLARLRALRRRATGALRPVIEIGLLAFDQELQVARAAGKRLPLTGKELRLFEILIMRAGRTLTKEQLLSAIYNDRDEPEIKIIDVFICKLRKKIAAVTGGDPCIETVWGRGYTIPREPDEARVAA